MRRILELLEVWWPGAESNQRRADFQSQTDSRNINCINRLAGAPVARVHNDA